MNQGKTASQQSRPGNDGSSSACTATGGGTGKEIVPVHSGSENSNRNSASDSSSQHEEDGGNYYVPGTSVIRIMRRAIPVTAKISDGAKETVQQCVSEFISLITSEANERCQREHRKTVTPEDILYAIYKLGFDNYVQPLTLYINRYREFESGRNSIGGEPQVFRTVNYQHIQGTPLPPTPPPMFYFNPQVAPPPLLYFFNPTEAMNGYQAYHIAPSGSTTSAGMSSTVAYAPTAIFGGYYPYTTYPPPPPSSEYYPGRQ